VSVPLNGEAERLVHSQVQEHMLSQFRDQVPVAAFQKAPKLHFTLLMVSAADDKAVESAKRVMQSSAAAMREIAAAFECLVDGKLAVQLAPGLATFASADDSNVTVLFRPPEAQSPAPSALRAMAERLANAFEAAGVTCSAPANLQLHNTVLNMRYANSDPFDAREVLQEYQKWPPSQAVHVPALHLSQMGAQGRDGYYRWAYRMFFDSRGASKGRRHQGGRSSQGGRHKGGRSFQGASHKGGRSSPGVRHKGGRALQGGGCKGGRSSH
jgi:2'-5' RNA ligase